MSETLISTMPAQSGPAPRIGFVSLGCPKALTDSELILTQLSAEGYQTSKTFDGSDLVIVNTCGFIDDAVKESLDTIAEALSANGKVIVTGCLGAKTGEAGGSHQVGGGGGGHSGAKTAQLGEVLAVGGGDHTAHAHEQQGLGQTMGKEQEQGQ